LSVSLKQRLRGDLALTLARTFTARAIAALGALGLMVVVGRLHGPAGVGVLALAQSFLLGAGLLSKSGMDNALMRYVGQDPDSHEVMRYFAWAVKRAMLSAFPVAFLLLLLRGYFESLFSSAGLAEMLIGVSLAVPFYVFGYLLSGFFKGVRKSATACLMENGAIALYAGGILWGGMQFAPEISESLLMVGYAYLTAAILVAFQGGLQLWLWCRKQTWYLHNAESDVVSRSQAVEKKQFFLTSRAFFAATFAGFMQNVLAVMLAGWLLISADLGLFKTSQQIGMLIAFILLVINAIFPPRFASLYHNGNMKGLSRLARLGAALGAVVAMPLVLVCLFFPVWVLGWFGSGFEGAAPLLRIIAVAQLVNVSTGSVGFLLNMTGHERLMRNIALTCNALGLGAFFVLISMLGAVGAAMALAFVLVCQNLVALFFVWRRLGIWTLPGPNVFALLGIRPAPLS